METKTGTYEEEIETGSIKVTIEPLAAITAGEQWKLTTGPDQNWKDSDDTIPGLPAGPYTITFKEITGWNKPADIEVSLATGENLVRTGTYTATESTPAPFGVSLYRQDLGMFYIKYIADTGFADEVFSYGPPGNSLLPVAEDWTNNGVSGVALYNQKSGTFYIRYTPDTGYADSVFSYGPPKNNWLPAAGRWVE